MSSMGFPVTRALREMRRKDAELRQAEYDKLTIDEKLAKLPPEPHAAKQRAKLLSLKNGKKPTSLTQNDDAVVADSSQPKKLKAKERRAFQKKGNENVE